jgi:transcriptional regulator with XRE-family HTH domain
MKKFRQSIYEAEHLILREWLVEKRKELGLTQRQLAEKLQVVHSLIGKVEKGERRLDFIECIAYCEALDLSPEEMLILIKKINKH